MIVLLPMRLAGDGRVAIGFDDRTVTAVLDGLAKIRPNYIELHMPKFKTEFGANLIPIFSDLGMALAFDQDRSDFPRYHHTPESDKEEDRIHISQIQHKAFIDVNEAGTEAAAATAVEFAARSAAPPRTVVRVDRPFLLPESRTRPRARSSSPAACRIPGNSRQSVPVYSRPPRLRTRFGQIRTLAEQVPELARRHPGTPLEGAFERGLIGIAEFKCDPAPADATCRPERDGQRGTGSPPAAPKSAPLPRSNADAGCAVTARVPVQSFPGRPHHFPARHRSPCAYGRPRSWSAPYQSASGSDFPMLDGGARRHRAASARSAHFRESSVNWSRSRTDTNWPVTSPQLDKERAVVCSKQIRSGRQLCPAPRRMS